MSEISKQPHRAGQLVPTATSPAGSARPIGRAVAGGASQQSVTPRFLANALRRWWKIAVPLGVLLGGAAAALVVMMFQPVYEASAIIEIGAPVDPIEPTGYDRLGDASFVQTELELIQGRLVLGPVSKRPEIARMPELKEEDDPVRYLRERIEVRRFGQSSLYEVSFTSGDPFTSQVIVNAVVEEYLKLRDLDKRDRTLALIEMFEGEAKTLEEGVEILGKEILTLSPRTTVNGSVYQEPDVALRQSLELDTLRRQFVAAEVERDAQVFALQLFEETMSEEGIGISDEAVASAVERHPDVQSLKDVIEGKKERLRERRRLSAAPENDPGVQKLQEEIVRDESELEQLREELKEVTRKEMESDRRAEFTEELDRMKWELKSWRATAQARREKYEEELKKYEEQWKEDGEPGDGSWEVRFKAKERSLLEERHDAIQRKITTLRFQLKEQGSIIVREKATTPVTPIESLPFTNAALAFLIGFCVPVSFAVGWEYLARRVSDADELEQLSNLKVVGEISRLPTRVVGKPSTRFERALNVFEESVDGLRTSLMLSETLRTMRVLAVASAATREGKTSVAGQLAVSIARSAGEPVLLVDGDLRSPDVHTLFQIPVAPGLAEFLAGECELEEAIVSSSVKHLHLLPAGNIRTSPHKLLGNGKLQALLDAVRPSYRFVIIDTPPILAASEALVLAKAADAALMCAMRDVSRIDRLNRARERLMGAGQPPIGTVLSGIPTGRYASRYGRYAYGGGRRAAAKSFD